MLFRTAHWRLVAWNVLVLCVILVLLEVVVYTVFTRGVYSAVDQELQTRQGDLARVLTQDVDLYQIASTPEFDPSTYRLFVQGANGWHGSTQCARQVQFMMGCPAETLVPTNQRTLQEVMKGGGTDERTVTFLGSPVRLLTFQLTIGGFPYVFQISRTVSGETASLNSLRLLLILGGLLSIVLAALASIFLAYKALVPIRQAFGRQRQFTADASHELRTPLALIRANAEMLLRDADRLPPGDDELITEIIRETDHLNRLVSDLLTLARADAETVKINQRPVDLRALVDEVHADVQRIAEARGIESDMLLNGAVTVPGDEMRLRQLLLILLDNALKYTDPGGRVDLELQRENGHAHLVVTDTGIGIPEQDLPHIFDRFYRVDRAREHESGGTGLGLSIAQWIVQAHNGSIKVASEIGKGTRFEVDLPVCKT